MNLEIAKSPFENTEKSLKAHSFSRRHLSHYPVLVEALLDAKTASARANCASSLFSEEVRDLVQQACEDLKKPDYQDLFQADVFQGGGGIGIHTNVNEAIRAYALEMDQSLDIKEQINLSQSTADVLATASHIALLRLSQKLAITLRETQGLFLKIARESEAVLTMARTCLRDALPAPMSKLFEGYSLVVERQIEAIESKAKVLEEVNLGGTVIGSGEGASLTYQGLVIPFLAEITELPLKRREHLFDAAQNNDRVASLSSELAQLASAWIKITKDLRLMGSGPLTGLNEITLPEAIPGSSFFENKTNPTVPETVLQACFLVLGNHRTVQATQEHAELFLNVFEMCAHLKVYESLEMLESSVSKFNQYCLANLKVNQESCEHWVREWERGYHA